MSVSERPPGVPSPGKNFRIAYCLPKITGGADLLQQKQIASGLQTRGHNLTFITSQNLFDTTCTKDLENLVRAQRTWSNSAWFIFSQKLAWRVQKGIGLPYLNVFSNYSLYDACLQCLPGHDLVQERNGLYRMGVAMACKRLKLPYILFFDADDLFELDYLGEPILGLLRWRAKQIIRYSLSVANVIITVSEATKRRLIDIWQVAEEKILVFPNGVDVLRFKPYPEKRLEIRASLGIGEAPMIVYIGGFYRWHDVAVLIDAFALMLNTYPHARLVLVGDGDQRREMLQLTEELGIEHAVIFTGLLPHEKMPYLLGAADIAVAPYPKMEYEWWGSSMKLFEYFAAGIAVVASNIGEQVSDVVQDRQNGLLVPPGEPSDLANALRVLVESPELRSQLGRRAREDAVEKHSLDRYITRLESVYSSVVNGQPVPRQV